MLHLQTIENLGIDLQTLEVSVEEMLRLQTTGVLAEEMLELVRQIVVVPKRVHLDLVLYKTSCFLLWWEPDYLLSKCSLQLTLVPDILVLTKTWLKPHTAQSELGLSNHIAYRKYRILCDSCSRGRGILIAVNENLNSSLIRSWANAECTFIRLTLQQKKVILRAAYIPPDSKLEKYSNFDTKLR